MKKLLVLAALGAVFAVCDMAFGGLTFVNLKKGDVAVQGPAKGVAVQAVSTNASGTVTLKRVTPLTETWRDYETVTVTNYADVATNLTRTVTNDLVRAMRLKYLGAGVVESNEVAVAKNEIPEYPPWPDIVIVTNKVVEAEVYTNWTYKAAVGTEVFMSFLGLGAQNEPSWGVMLDNARARLWQGVWWEGFFVTAAVFGLVLAANQLGDILRDRLDPVRA